MSGVPANCVVTGGSGFVGQRLVEMLVERGAKRVVSFDIAPKPKLWGASDDPRIDYMQGDLTKLEDVMKAVKGADCVWHIAALVGPYFDQAAYEAVNYRGTLNVIEACKKHGVKKVVMSSSPSTRFDGKDICGKRAFDLRIRPKGQFLQAYAETKAMGEEAMCAACDGKGFLTVAIAPHQVYGPRDMLFLHNFLAAHRKLRVMGNGENKVSLCHVDNYCHGLIIGEKALYPGSPALGKFYIVTDGEPQYFWKVIDHAYEGLGYPSLFKRAKLPVWFIMPIALIVEKVGECLGKKFKLNTFAVKMMVIHRYFDISDAERDLGYKPVVPFEKGWAQTVEWFRDHWKPKFGM